jgi:O-acetylhomoserine (thiol)-lyase
MQTGLLSRTDARLSRRFHKKRGLMTMENNLHFDTLMVHAGREDETYHSVVQPIYQTTAYEFESADHARALFELKEAGNIYTRLGNPTNDALEKRVAALDGGVGALAVSSGHAAIFLTIANLACQGDEIVSSKHIYGGAINMLGISLKRLGINVKFVDCDDLEAWEAAITGKTKALFVESIGNPNANVADIGALADIAHRHGIPLIVDATSVTPYLQKPIEWGADIVIHSATKYLGGHGTSMGGIVVDSGKFEYLGNERFPLFNEPDESYHGIVFGKDCGNAGFITRLRALLLRDFGMCQSPFNAFMLIQGIETLSLRMKQHVQNAMKIAQFLDGNPHVTSVSYPGLASSKYKALADKYLPNGAGALFTFEIEGTRETGARFIDSLKLFKNVANLGDVRSLVSHPATTTHSQLTAEQLTEAGISTQTIRLSVGIEDAGDLIADLEQAIAKAVR